MIKFDDLNFKLYKNYGLIYDNNMRNIFEVIFVLSILLFSTYSKADGLGGATCMPNCNAYVQEDHFKWTNYDDQMHMLAGFTLSVTSAMIMEHGFHMTRLESAIFGAVIGGVVGTSKEVFLDDYTSRTDIKSWWIGSLTAGAAVTVLRF